MVLHPLALILPISSSIFAGSGITINDALFCYKANWESPGRWGVEVCTRKHKLVFRPLEKLQIHQIGSIELKEVDIDDEIDKKYKPGLFRQVKNFLGHMTEQFCTIEDQINSVDFYYQMAGYR